MQLSRRPRRNRKSAVIRSLVRETHVSTDDLIYPLFLQEGEEHTPIASMPGIFRFSIAAALEEIASCIGKGIRTFILFPALDDAKKDRVASHSYQPDNFYLQAISRFKKEFPEICFISDVAMDPYSSDGHDGLVVDGKIANDETLPILAKMALAQAEAGIDILGPSDMMDGRVAYLRDALDAEGHSQVSIMSYTAKYASHFYGPFRDALDSAPKSGDKKTYQMDPANRREAILEAIADEEEGADFVMVKPALSYLDVIAALKEEVQLPVVAYNVSGEYSMVCAAAQKGWLDKEKVMQEILLSIKRAGADMIVTYYAKDYAQLYLK
ncbi:MAG: porphobilinogen synthase [Spirochaetota bacterium]